MSDGTNQGKTEKSSITVTVRFDIEVPEGTTERNFSLAEKMFGIKFADIKSVVTEAVVSGVAAGTDVNGTAKV